MSDREKVKDQIRAAFARVDYPGDWCLRGSDEGDEPYLVDRDFKGKTDWRILDPAFIDQSPDGLASALSFFSHEAFRFFLPAYLVADIDGRLERSDPLFHLTHGLDNSSRSELINLRRYGERTWFDQARFKFAMFTKLEAAAIVAYMRLIAESTPSERRTVEEALKNFWSEKGGEQNAPPNGGPATLLGNSGVAE